MFSDKEMADLGIRSVAVIAEGTLTPVMVVRYEDGGEMSVRVDRDVDRAIAHVRSVARARVRNKKVKKLCDGA